MKKGFGLLQALFVIVLIGGILSLAMKYSRISIEQTKDLYVREGAELFLNSAVEITLLAISGHNRSTNDCLKGVHVTSKDRRYEADVNITKYYVYNGNDNDGTTFNCDRNFSIETEDSHGMVMLEIEVETNNKHPKNKNTNITLRRRTLQRP